MVIAVALLVFLGTGAAGVWVVRGLGAPVGAAGVVYVAVAGGVLAMRWWAPAVPVRLYAVVMRGCSLVLVIWLFVGALQFFDHRSLGGLAIAGVYFGFGLAMTVLWEAAGWPRTQEEGA